MMTIRTIHRIASNGEQRGVFHSVLNWCSVQCPNIRIDTHQDNARMIHLIEQAQFTRCGTIYTRDNSPRIAYQRVWGGQRSCGEESVRCRV